jgi:hypothetical protein
MRLAADAEAQLERFLRAYLRDEGLRLPALELHAGRLAGVLTRALRVGAITFGRHVFVAQSWCERSAGGDVRVPAWLVAHEAVHVVQYGRAGAVRFLRAYLRDYVRAIWRGRSLSAAGHASAYNAIAHEVEAFAAETAYREWVERAELFTLR